MDLHLQANPRLQYGVNRGAGRNSRPGEDDALRFLSQEEQECLQFFEKTIDSLEESLEENNPRPGQVKPAVSSSTPIKNAGGPLASSPSPGVIVSPHHAKPSTPKDQDIIDLVCQEPDLVQNRERMFNPTCPDFQSMLPAPESHFEIKPGYDSMDNLPSDYNPPLPSGSYGPTDSHSSYHPPGSIPTPVLIAQKIAENNASLESEKPSSPTTDLPAKQGPPTFAKPTRFPSNISVILGSKDHQNHSLSNVNVQERRALMLANLTGSHPLLQEDPLQALKEEARNVPRRSFSFKDPTPDKSRMEALSKLGLTRNRAMSGGMSVLLAPNSPSVDPHTGAETSAKPEEASVPPTTEAKSLEADVTKPLQSWNHVDRKSEILRTDSLRSHKDKSPPSSPLPPVVAERNYCPPPLENQAAGVTSLEFNSYGGKSVVVNSTFPSKSEPPTSPTLPPALANPSEFNSYGGKTKVLTPAPPVMNESDLPDILSSHIAKSQTPPAKSEPLPIELNSYGGKSRTINPSTHLSHPSTSPARGPKPPAPTPAPRPPRHSYHGPVTSQKPAQRATSPEHKRRPGSLFRPQGITVQFSGRGSTDESRRDALRKLGLLKDS